MSVVAHDLHPNPRVKKMEVPYATLEELLPVVDVLTLHMPLNDTNHHYVDKEK